MKKPERVQQSQRLGGGNRFGCVATIIVILAVVVSALFHWLGPPYTALADDERDGCRQAYSAPAERTQYEDCMDAADRVERGGR